MAEHSPQQMSGAVGFQFVRQYYTVLNRDPAKLHCFYKKNSLFTHADEGVEVEPSRGQQSINTQIEVYDFQNCKVVVSQLDTQPSLNEGVIVMVLGEMSNKGEPSRRFAQTFFLVSEEPGRYYVLNDIFRFLKDVPATQVEMQSTPPSHSHHAISEPEIQSQVEVEPEVEMPDEVEIEIHQPASSIVPEPTPAPAVIPTVAEIPKQEHPPVASPSPSASSSNIPVASPSPVGSPSPAPEKPQQQQQQPPQQQQQQQQQHHHQQQHHQQQQRSAPQNQKAPSSANANSWAARAATHSPQQWGSQASQVKGITVEHAQETPKERHEKPERHERFDRNEGRERDRERDRDRDNRRNHPEPDNDVSVFIRDVTGESQGELREHFAQFGTVHNITFLKNTNAAFVDFASVDQAEAAINAAPIRLQNGSTVKAERRNRPRQAGERGNERTGGDRGDRGDRRPEGRRPQGQNVNGPSRRQEGQQQGSQGGFQPNGNSSNPNPNPKRREENGVQKEKEPKKDSTPAAATATASNTNTQQNAQNNQNRKAQANQQQQTRSKQSTTN